jgi:periplasmic protein TonB
MASHGTPETARAEQLAHKGLQLVPKSVKSPNQNHSESTDKFISAMFDFSPTEKVRRSPWQTALSVAVHVVLIGAAIIAPIYFANDALDLKGTTTTMLVAPPAPAPPPPAAIEKVVKPTLVQTAKVNPFVMPRVIPKAIPTTKDESQAAPPPDEFAGVPGGVEGGVSGGVLGGVLGGSGTGPAAPAAPKPPAMLRVGGDVKPPRLIARVEPTYPPIAKTAHVEGMVDIEAVIDPQGNVVRAHAVSGPGLLIPAALAAVDQWKYAPTYLNGQPVSIAMQVQVEFSLSSKSSGF